MGKPAARSILDQAGHLGPITTGSPNVLIGGAPAARKGDAFICTDPQHGGSGTIIEGSKTVLINGIPAARMGDKTDCAAIPTPPPVVSGSAEDIIYRSTFAKNTNDDGTVKTSRPDNSDVKAFYAERGKQDKTGEGTYDYVHAGIGVMDMSLQGMYSNESGYDIVGGGGNFEFLKAEAGAGIYQSNGIDGYEASASAAVAKGDAHVSFGDSDIYRVDGKASGEVLSAEAKAHRELYTGGDENKYGFMIEAGAEAQVVKGDLEFGTSNRFYDATAKIGASAASVGAGAEALFYVDTDDHYVRAKIGGELALLLGLSVDLDLSLKWGWVVDIYDYIFKEDAPAPIIYAGTIISGSSKVLIGE